MRLDEIDHKILARLTDHGRESFAMLGHHIGLSTAATKRRVDRLRLSGVIRRFTAEIEPAALGWTIEAFVEVYCEGRVPPERMREMVSTIPEVAEAYTVTGEADGILRVRAALFRWQACLPTGVVRFHSSRTWPNVTATFHIFASAHSRHFSSIIPTTSKTFWSPITRIL